MNLKLDPDFINEMEYLLNEQLEYCGNLKVEGDILKKRDINVGYELYKDGNIRNACNHKDQNATDYWYHTHPEKSFSYPSYEDLNSIVKHPTKTSFIFTLWGMWVIQADKINIPQFIEKQDYVDATNDLRAQLSNKGSHRSLPYFEVREIVNELIEMYKTLFSLSISLIEWRDINSIIFTMGIKRRNNSRKRRNKSIKRRNSSRKRRNNRKSNNLQL